MIIYICAYFVVSVLFLKLLSPVIASAIFEHDLLFFLPMVVGEMQGLPFIKLISYWVLVRLDHAWTDYPMIKAYISLVLSLFGSLPKGFIYTSIFFHFGNSGLIYWLCRQLKLTARGGFLASVIYLTIFAHFDAYIWPLAIQHLLVIFFALLGLNLYLKADRFIASGVKWRGVYMAALLINAAASFCRFSIWVLPAMMLAHILICSKDGWERVKKYNIWTPAFIFYLIYPVYSIVGLADQKIYGPIYCLLPFGNRAAIIEKLIFGIPVSIKFSIAFLSGLGCLFGLKAALMIYQRHNLKRFLKRSLMAAGLLIALALLLTGGPKRFLIPYNLLVPFIGLFGSITAPLQNALLIDPVMAFHFIPLTAGPFNLLSAAAILVLFIKSFGAGYRKLAVLGVWYVFSLMLLYLWNPVASRYLIYVSPIFCIVFAGALDYAYASLTQSLRPSYFREAVFVFIACVVFCVPNMLAIKLADFRGRMTDNFFVYDYSRAAGLVRADLAQKNRIADLKNKTLNINNSVPLIISGSPRYLFPKDPRNDKARWIFMQALDDSSVVINFNEAPGRPGEHITYTMDDEGYGIYDAQGQSIDAFSRAFERGLEELRLGEHGAALKSMKAAARVRPHLLNYVLPGLELQDARWIVGDSDMFSWLEEVRCFHSYAQQDAEWKKNAYIWGVINREIEEYIQCLFYVSFLEYSIGRHEESEYWFSQIRFLERDFEKLHSLLSETSPEKPDKRISDFLNNQSNVALYVRPENYRDRYKFAKFLLRLTFKQGEKGGI